mmetsp:Transcript_43267/g.108370  ORF Transcript_43267/g.108370 Transcript_43267/m.108370 type:complete len:257 (+) Transcript_43267:189-959(+)
MYTDSHVEGHLVSHGHHARLDRQALDERLRLLHRLLHHGIPPLDRNGAVRVAPVVAPRVAPTGVGAVCALLHVEKVKVLFRVELDKLDPDTGGVGGSEDPLAVLKVGVPPVSIRDDSHGLLRRLGLLLTPKDGPSRVDGGEALATNAAVRGEGDAQEARVGGDGGGGGVGTREGLGREGGCAILVGARVDRDKVPPTLGDERSELDRDRGSSFGGKHPAAVGVIVVLALTVSDGSSIGLEGAAIGAGRGGGRNPRC